MRDTRAESLRRQLADDIVGGRLAPGVKLDEQELADRFGVSRTPVREALKQLAASGLAETRPHKGVVVAVITPERLAEMFEVLAGLEAMAARLAAERMSAPERHDLERLHLHSAALVRDGDPDAYEEVNVRFHAAIFRGSHNDYLTELAQSVRARVRPFSRGQFRLLGRLARSFAEHAQIVAAIQRGNGAAAEQAMLRHVARVGDASADYVMTGQTPRGAADRPAVGRTGYALAGGGAVPAEDGPAGAGAGAGTVLPAADPP